MPNSPTIYTEITKTQATNLTLKQQISQYAEDRIQALIEYGTVVNNKTATDLQSAYLKRDKETWKS